jgi:Fe-S cluster biogenesis protein NfuA
MVPVGRSVRTLGDVRDQVEEVITVIRPAIQADNGDVILHDVDEETGIVTVELIGACVSCAASTITLKAGLERIMKDRVPGVTEVINLGDVVDPIAETAVTL